MQAEAMEIISGLQDLSPEEQKEHMPELMKMIGEKGKEMQAKVDKVLDAEAGRAHEGAVAAKPRCGGPGRRRSHRGPEDHR